ncbi:MAG: maleylpyruvate isomerase N-terminal domain-containing protein [Chloroflexota bacterium]
MSTIPNHLIHGCKDAHRRLEASLIHINDTVVRRASLLDGWTVGHVLNHLARNAESHTGVFHAAAEGRIRAQYPGGPDERVQLIETGADNPADVLIEALRKANSQLELAWANTSDEHWASGLGLRTYGAASLAEFVFLRWREVEIHGIDLGIADIGGPTWESVSDDYVNFETEMSGRGLPSRLPPGVAVHIVPDGLPSYVAGLSFTPLQVRGSAREILRWLTGRHSRQDWPTLGAW